MNRPFFVIIPTICIMLLIGITLAAVQSPPLVPPLSLGPVPTATPAAAPVSAGPLAITAPRAGEVLALGQMYSITWSAAPQIGRVWLGYSECSTCLTWIAPNVPNTGCYNWLVRTNNPHGTQFKLVIVGQQTGVKAVTARSDGAFTIVNSPQTPRVAQSSSCGYVNYLPLLMR